DEVAMRSAADFGGDQFIAYGTWKWMEIDRQTGNKNIYRYKFDLGAPPSKSHWASQASHADDIEYVFGTLDTLQGVVWRPEDYALSEQMGSIRNFVCEPDDLVTRSAPIDRRTG